LSPTKNSVHASPRKRDDGGGERRQEGMARTRIARIRIRIRRRGCGIFSMPSMRFERMDGMGEWSVCCGLWTMDCGLRDGGVDGLM